MSWCESSQKYSVLLFVCINILFGVYSIKKANKKYETNKFPNNKLYITIIILFIVSSVTISTQNVLCQLLITYLTGFTLHYIGLSLLFLFYVLYFHKTYAMAPSLMILFLILFIMQISSALSTETFVLLNCIQIAKMSHIAFFTINITSNILLLYILARTIHVLGQEIKDDYNYKIDAMSRSIAYDTTCTNADAVEVTVLRIELSSTTKSKSSLFSVSIAKKNPKRKPKKRSKKRSKKNKILSKVVRITVCAMISFISSNIMNILCIYRLHVSGISAINDEILWVSHLMIIITDQTIIMISLYLIHKHSKKLYQKRCTKLHFCVYHLFVVSGKKANIQKKPQNEQFNGDYKYSTTGNDTTATPDHVPELQRDRVTDLDTSSSF